MAQTYNEARKAAKYKLLGSGSRCIGNLMEILAPMDPNTEADIYGAGDIIHNFEQKLAQFLGKEKAVFFPSGTMAQQIALRIWSDQADLKKVAYHPLCHLEIHEKDGLKELHHIESILLGSKERLFHLEDLKAIASPVSCLLIELPQREIGGQLPSWEELQEISHYCKEKGIKLHLDGARLFECLPYYNKTAVEICSLFDSVYVSFYKGLGGIAGAILAGPVEFTEESKVWKRRHGGDLISLYPYILNAKHCFDKRLGRMEQYWNSALLAAKELNQIPGIHTIPEVPVCNMFHAYFDVSLAVLQDILIHIAEQCDVALFNGFMETSDNSCKTELSFGDSFGEIPPETLQQAFHLLKEGLGKL